MTAAALRDNGKEQQEFETKKSDVSVLDLRPSSEMWMELDKIQDELHESRMQSCIRCRNLVEIITGIHTGPWTTTAA